MLWHDTSVLKLTDMYDILRGIARGKITYMLGDCRIS